MSVGWAYSELSRAPGYEIIGDDDFYLVWNRDLEVNVGAHKKVGDWVKIEKDKTLYLDDTI